MITCKDCYHQKACQSMLEAQGYCVSENFIGDATRCDTFKDKSLVLDLPCKVGEIVYHINTFSSRNPIIKEVEVDALHITSGKNKRGHNKPSYVLVRDIMMQSLSTRIYFEEFGKTLFLTKESAEQALKEMEQG